MASKLSIIIPVFNEEKLICNTLQNVLLSDTLGLTKEIIVVDDGSTDNSYQLIKKFIVSHKLKSIITIKHKTNLGKTSALKSGISKSTGDFVIIQDADMEYDPKDYPNMITPLVNQLADAVYGSRFVTTEYRRVLYFWHYFANTFLTTVSNIFTNLNLTDIETGYKAFRGELIRSLISKIQSRQFGFEPEITARLAKIKKIRIYEVGISYNGRTYQEGKKIVWQDGLLALFQIIKYNVFVDF